MKPLLEQSLKPYYVDDSVTLYLGRDDETPDQRKKRLARERMRRWRARKSGVDVPMQPRPRGYRQSPEHVAARSRFGAEHYAWAGEVVSKKQGRKRALRLYPNIGPCVRCGASVAERHHVDENTSNNHPDNIEALCRPCHVAEHRRRRSA